jgi:membrane-associated phospholipid phosphatase
VSATGPIRVSPRSLLWCLLLGVAVVVALGLSYEHCPVATIDREVAQWVAANMPSWVEWIGRIFSRLGGWLGWPLISAALVVLLFAKGRTADALWAAATIIAIYLAVTPLIKEVFDRPRPDVGSAIPLPFSYSFPSGHASGAVVMFALLALFGVERWPERSRRLWVGAAVVALAVGASRVVLNVHHVSDVIAGFALGLAWLAAMLLVRGSRRYPWAHGRHRREVAGSAARGDRDPARLGP